MQTFSNIGAPALSLNEDFLSHCATIYRQLPPEELTKMAVARGEGVLTENGTLMCSTGKFTGRSPKDKFIVQDEKTLARVNWNEVNQPFESGRFNLLYQKMITFLENKEVFVRHAYVGADKRYRRSLVAITTLAWHSLFCDNLFIRPNHDELDGFSPEWQLICVPEFKADPAIDGTRQENFTIVDFTRKIVLIGGSGYAGEMKKGMFTVMNYLMPVEDDVLPMHCSANIGPSGDTALFFGLSGTGKTTLSASPDRALIGDDEHGWSHDNIFNFEGGCYAKVVNLTKESEPQIFAAIRPGSILENTRYFKGTNKVDYADISITENTRVAYPLDFIPNALPDSLGNAPKNVFLLTADAFGVLPPLAKLNEAQAMFYFLAGYTSKLAGTEMGITQPIATFSACFGAAFLPLSPKTYAKMLGEKLTGAKASVWLLNTGWVKGAYGVGERIALNYTRKLLNAALSGELNTVDFINDEVFGLQIPTECRGVPKELLNPSASWQDKSAYFKAAEKLQAELEIQVAKLQIA